MIKNSNIHPINFCIPEKKMINSIPQKTKDFASLVPGDRTTYTFTNEDAYYKEYQCSYYGITMKKNGWDCLRHYEIIMNGCIPYFVDLKDCPEKSLIFLPKQLILEAMNLDGVNYSTMTIDHAIFDKTKYFDILTKMMEHSKTYLTTRSIASYILNTVNTTSKNINELKVLFLCKLQTNIYLRTLVHNGMHLILGENFVDAIKKDFMYSTYRGGTKRLYGLGFTYSKLCDDIAIDRNDIMGKIKNKYFDYIIFTSIHKGRIFLHDKIKKYYEPERLIYLCGGDIHEKCFLFNNESHYFIRELGSIETFENL